jgi:hypothetical protein
MARKPLVGTVAANVQKWGTGGINVDGCRIGTEIVASGNGQLGKQGIYGTMERDSASSGSAIGRFPANVCLDEEAAAMLDEQAGERGGGQATEYDWADSRNDNPSRIAHNIKSGIHFGDAGGPSRFFYTAKASRSEREAGLDGQEIITVEWRSWEEEDRKARLRVDTGQFPPRVIGASGIPENSASEWSTFLFGNPTTAPSLIDSRSITATAIGSITQSRTLSWLVRLLTSAGIRVVSGAAGNGGSRVGNAASLILLPITISDEAVSLPGAERVALETPLTISDGGTPANHPTVKPISLMRWLCRLVTPPGGVILDPFSGSGSTGVAAIQEGFRVICLDREGEYSQIAQARSKGINIGLPFGIRA